jgi:hypothetical protein
MNLSEGKVHKLINLYQNSHHMIYGLYMIVWQLAIVRATINVNKYIPQQTASTPLLRVQTQRLKSHNTFNSPSYSNLNVLVFTVSN